jgi:phosphoglucomutase
LSSRLNPLAGQPAPAAVLVDIPKLITAYYSERPDPQVPAQRVAFGTSGHRGSSLEIGFNEAHVLSISQAICEYRKLQNIDGPLFMGFDTHALSAPAFASAMEVLAANGVDTMIAPNDEYTPTPAVSLAILNFNRGRSGGLADGIVITPSHNPPRDGGFKYNPPHGGPADTDVTGAIQERGNALLGSGLAEVKRVPFERALRANTTHRHDYIGAYVGDLDAVIDMAAIRDSGLRLGVDPLGGAGVHYWPRIAEHYRIDIEIVDNTVDPTFGFMTRDWDGQIRMDPSSPYAMQRLVALKDRFEVAVACDPDYDRHGIVTRSAGLMPPNHYLSVAVSYLFRNRPEWPKDAAVGKTLVSSSMLDRVAASLGRAVYEVPVGFKWFVPGLLDGALGFGGEESAGASFVRRAGGAWTTDKDGMAPALLAAEITARLGRDPGEVYRALTDQLGDPAYQRIDAPATPEQKRALSRLSSDAVRLTDLAGEKITQVLTRAPGNDAPIGGLKVVAETGWFAARPSGTEDVYKVYAESFRGPEVLSQIIADAQTIVADALAAPAS